MCEVLVWALEGKEREVCVWVPKGKDDALQN